MLKKPRQLLAYFLFVISVMIVIGCSLFFPVVSDDEGVIYYLAPNTSSKTFVHELSQQSLVPFPALFSLYISLQDETPLKTGEYLFPKGSSLISIWRQVTTGTGQVQYAFTIIPGWTFKKIRVQLAQLKEIQHTITDLSDQQIMAALGYPQYSPEGLFFPDTYHYIRNNTDMFLLKRAFMLMQKKLQAAWEMRAPLLPYQQPYEALIAASLIEKEASLDSERPLIAGVLINRLRKNMLLQIDPTVIYGMGDRYQGKIYKEDLRSNNPYNTYARKGLPPTPIAMPSFPSIEAALHPQQHEYYYFVTKGGKSHQFSQTLTEHNQAVAVSPDRRPAYFNDVLIRKYMEKYVISNAVVTLSAQ